MKKEEAQSIFVLAKIIVMDIRPLPDGYGYPPTDERYFSTLPEKVWWFVKTPSGWVEIGWRKRVISINWSDTNIKKIVTQDDVTKNDWIVHAWSVEKAIEYLSVIADELNTLK